MLGKSSTPEHHPSFILLTEPESVQLHSASSHHKLLKWPVSGPESVLNKRHDNPTPLDSDTHRGERLLLALV